MRLFTFDDIAKLEDREIQRVLKELDSKTLALALIAANEELMGRILRNMGSRGGLILREEIELLGSRSPGDVASAQRELIEIALALVEQGHIVISQ